MKTISQFLCSALLSLVLIAPWHVSAVIIEPGFEREVVASGFILPVAMSFAHDGRIFVAEKSGTVRVVQNGQLAPEPVITLTDVNTFGDRGLLGIAVDPNFESNGFLYLSYTYENTPGSNFAGPKTGRIVRVTVVGNTALESSKFVLVGSIGGGIDAPSCENFPVTADCIPSDSGSHSVGGLRFGPDGKLYATLGDGANFDYADPLSLRAQNIDSLAGKVLRINTDGSAPADNPHFNGNVMANRSKVYASGVRNAFRFNFSPNSGALYVGDVGWSSREEVNKIISGANYGWPCWEGTVLTIHNCSASTTNPIYEYPHNEFGAGSITVGDFAHSNAYPAAYDTTLFVGDYAQNWIKRLVLNENDEFVSIHDFMDDPDGPVDISAGPDGSIYYLSIYTGELNRITHTTGNRRPVVSIFATPTAGLTPLSVVLSSDGTYDPDGDVLTYDWNFGDGAASSEEDPVHTYSLDGTYTASLTVADIHGSSASQSVVITVGNQAPTAHITSPSSGSLYKPNDIVDLSGEGLDLEDGSIPASNFHWRIILHHNTHIHIEQEFIGVKNPWFIAPDHNATDVYTEVELTVTDSNNLSHTTSVNLYLDNSTGAGNLIPNPSVEVPEDGAGINPLYWIRGNYGFNNPTFTYPVPGFDGARAAAVSMDFHSDGNAKWYFSPISVSPGEQYLYSNFYTASVPTAHSVQFGKSDGTYQYLFLGDSPATTVPTQVNYLVTVPANIETMTIWHELSDVGILTTDTFSLTHVENTNDTTAPSIYISSPIDSAILDGTIMVTVAAADAGGVADVQLLVDGYEYAAEVVGEPYFFSLDTTYLSNGLHVISARARDNSGNISYATPIHVTFANAAQNLVINGNFELENGPTPFNWGHGGWGDHTRVYTYPILGYDGGRAARVEIINYPDAPVGNGDSKWFFTKIPITPGIEYFYRDYYRSDTISDIIGQYTLSTGEFHYFGLQKEIQPTLAWASTTGTFTPPEGATHVTLFHLISSEGFLEIDDVSLTEMGAGFPSETNAPIVEITNPVAHQTIHGTVTLSASSTDDTAVTYIFYAIDGIPLTGQITSAPYNFEWDTTTIVDGEHLIKATTHDPYGNNSTHTITVTVDNTSPTGDNRIANPSLEAPGPNGDPQAWYRGGWGDNDRVFTYPTEGSHGFDAAKIEITSLLNGDAKWYFADVAVLPGEVYVFSHEYKSTVSTELLVRYTLIDGSIQYQYLGTRAPAGNWTQSLATMTAPVNAVSLTVFHILHSVGSLEVDNFSLTEADVTPPMVTLDSPIGGTVSGTTTVSGTASDASGIVGVTFIVDAVENGAEDTSAPYEFAWDTTVVTNGAHVLSLRARDAAGNTATSTVTVDVSNYVPAVGNLIVDPYLEQIDVVGQTAWKKGGWGMNNRTFSSVSTGKAAIGAKVEITNYTNGDAKWYFEDVPVTPGATYTFSNYYQSNVSTELLARVTRVDGTILYMFLKTLPASGSTGAYSLAQFTVPSDAASVTVFHILHAAGYLVTDTYKLYEGAHIPDTIAPIVAITAPLEGTTITTGTTISVVSDVDEYVAIAAYGVTVDGVSYVEDSTSQPGGPAEDEARSITLPLSGLSQGSHILHTWVRDVAGNIGTSSPISITIDTGVDEPPLVSLIANPSFEIEAGANTPAQWTTAGWGTNTRVFTYPVAGTHGDNGARIEMTSYTNGDAKWRHDDVAVVPGQEYTFTHDYRSNVTTNITARYTMTNGTYQYISLGNFGPVADWTSIQQTFLPPQGAASVTILHILNSVGWLEVDAYELIEGNPNMFANGMVSLTFDDGWISQYATALPILNAANMKGTFFITSQETLNAVSEELVYNPSLEEIDFDDEGYPKRWHPGGWGTNDRTFAYPIAGETGQGARVEMTSYTDGDAKWWFEGVAVIPGQTYRFEDSYMTDTITEIVLEITLTDDTVQHVYLDALPSTNGVWQRYSRDVELPTNARLVTLYHILASVGTLTIDNMSVKRVPEFLNTSQMLEMQTQGHEIAAHTQTHANLTTISTEQAQQEIAGSRAELLGAGITSVASIAYPFGAYNPAVQQMVRDAGFIGARGVERGFNTKATDKFALKIQSMNRSTTLVELQEWINEAIADNAWLVLMFHQVDDDLSKSLGVSPIFFQETVNAIATSGIEVISFEDAIARMNP